MYIWYAIAFGALDVSQDSQFPGIDMLALPTLPSPPLGLSTEAGNLWRRLLATGCPESELTQEERELIYEFKESGLASTDENHSARIAQLDEPWFLSPLHELTTSLVVGVARTNEISVIVIKGPTLHRQGLRSREHSGDVDIWVSPSELSQLANLMRDWGWRTKPDVWSGTSIFHSETLIPHDWGCEIDLHRRFPGIGLPDAEAFSALLLETEAARFAGTATLVPNRSVHAIILALHSLRPEPGTTTSQRQILEASEQLSAVGEIAIRLATSLDADGPLHPALMVSFHAHILRSPKRIPKNWSWREQSSQARYYLSGLLSAPISRWPKILRNVIWPSNELMRTMNEYQGTADNSMRRSKLTRLHRWLSRRHR